MAAAHSLSRTRLLCASEFDFLRFALLCARGRECFLKSIKSLAAKLGAGWLPPCLANTSSEAFTAILPKFFQQENGLRRDGGRRVDFIFLSLKEEKK